MKVVCAGEAMIEISIDAPGRQVGFAGDTFNTAVYMARALPPGSVDYATVVGEDALAEGRAAAASIDEYLMGETNLPSPLPASARAIIA